jgi:hypothetical protein
MIAQVDDEESIKKLLRAVAKVVGYWPVRVVIDKSEAAMNAIKALKLLRGPGAPPLDFDFVLCQFHVMQAVKRWCVVVLFCFLVSLGFCNHTSHSAMQVFCKKEQGVRR